MVTAPAALTAALAFLAVTRSAPPARRGALAGVLIIALAAAGLRVGGSGSIGTIVVGAALLLVGVLTIVVAIRRPGPGGDAIGATGFDSATPAWLSGDPVAVRLLSIHAAGALLALVAPHLHLLGLGVALSAVGGALLERRLSGDRALQIGQGILILLLLGSWYALTAVAGEAPLRLDALGDAPYSQAFEVTVALPLALTAWPLLGLFPFHKTQLGPLSAVAGGALLIRVAALAVPTGLAHWQPLLYLFTVVAMGHAMVTRRDAEALAALGALGLLSGSASAGWGGLGLVAGVTLVRCHALLTASGRILNARGKVVVQCVAVVAALLLVPMLAGGLAAEAVYSVVIVLTGALFLWRR